MSWTSPVLLLFLVLAACAPTSHRSEAGARLADTAPSAEDSVWAAVLDSLYSGPRTKELVVRERTERFRQDSVVPAFVAQFQRLPGVEQGTLDDFWAKSPVPRSVGPLPRTRVPVAFVSRATLDSLPKGHDISRRGRGEMSLYWVAFYERHPGSSGIISLSRVGFNAARTQAVVNVDRACGGLCGNGTIILLTRDTAGRWRVEQTVGTWAS